MKHQKETFSYNAPRISPPIFYFNFQFLFYFLNFGFEKFDDQVFLSISFYYAKLLGIGFTSILLVVSENFDKILPGFSSY
jgi:hypothetical protein